MTIMQAPHESHCGIGRLPPYEKQCDSARPSPRTLKMIQEKNLKILILLALISFGGLPAPRASAAEVLAMVDNAPITRTDVQLAMEDIGKTLPRQLGPEQREAYVLNYLIDLHLTANSAAKANLHKSAAFERKLEYFRKKALMEAYMDAQRKGSITEAKIREVYENAAKDHKPEAEINASHILVATKEEAEAALKRVMSGEDFAAVAKQVSKDPGSPGGSLGWFTKGRMVPVFSEVAFKTETGKISPPVQTQFGWHIIKVEARRKTTFPGIETVRSQIEQFLMRKNQRLAIEQLRKGARIERSPTTR